LTIIDYPSVGVAGVESFIPIFQNAVSFINIQITKMSLTCKESDDPTDSLSSIDQISKGVSILIQSAVSVIAEIQAGSHLTSMIRTKVKLLVNAIKNLSNSLKKQDYENDNIPRLTGIVWQFCKTLQELPLDNKKATLEALKLIEPPLKDAMVELEELLKNVNTEEESEEGGENEEDEDNIFDFKSSTKLTPEELELIPGAVQIVKLAFMFVQRVEKIIEMSSNNQNEKSYGLWLSDLYSKSKEISEAVDNFVLSIDPPLDRSELEEKFREITEIIISSIYIIKQNQIANRESVQVLLDSMLQKFSTAKLIQPK